jgi:hypothetical protein
VRRPPMSDAFEVEVHGESLPVAGDRPVVFHGVNKSGSAAMSDVMREAYEADGRGERFASTYHQSPRGLDAFSRLLLESTGHRFFVSHYIYGKMALPPDAVLFTQLRHPLPRTLSVYGWIMRARISEGASPEQVPTLERWVRSTRGVRHSQMAQFATPPADGRRVESLPAHEVYASARENFKRDVAWYGIAELFEESIFTLAHICSLPSVPPWRKDTRNAGRPALASQPREVIDLIEKTFEDEIRFYNRALWVFRRRLQHIRFGPSLAAYKRRCSGEYGERLVS